MAHSMISSGLVIATILLLVIIPPVAAQPHTDATPSTIQPASDARYYQGIQPVSITANRGKSLEDIVVAQKVVEAERKQEQQAYDQIRSRVTESAQAEQALQTAQLGDQRARLLYAILNNVIVIYQRIDFLVEKMDVSLLKLRSIYIEKSRDGKEIPQFSTRYAALEDQFDDLVIQRDRATQKLNEAQASVTLSNSIRAAMQEVRILIQDARAFLGAYRSLAQDVVSL